MCGYFPEWSFSTVNFDLFWAFCYLNYSLFTDRGIRILIIKFKMPKVDSWPVGQ